MISIYLGKEIISIHDECTLLEFTKINKPHSNFAVAINHQFIPKSNYAITFLKNNDQIEFIIPMQGG